ACPDLPRVIRLARERGLQVGLAFNPETSPEEAAAAADGVDLVLCMSIHPGYSGQRFMPEALDRVGRLRSLVEPGVHVQVDGGVGPDKARRLVEAGANLLVVGTAIFGEEDPPAAYRRLGQLVA